jgi:hypothetical protein
VQIPRCPRRDGRSRRRGELSGLGARRAGGWAACDRSWTKIAPPTEPWPGAGFTDLPVCERTADTRLDTGDLPVLRRSAGAPPTICRCAADDLPVRRRRFMVCIACRSGPRDSCATAVRPHARLAVAAPAAAESLSQQSQSRPSHIRSRISHSAAADRDSGALPLCTRSATGLKANPE